MPLKGAERESKILELFAKGELPEWFSKNPWPSVVVDGVGKSAFHTLTYFPAPMYFALGTDADPAFVPTCPETFATMVSKMACVMPTKRMVRDIWDAANVKMQLADVKGKPYYVPLTEIETTRAMKLQSDMIKADPLYRAPSASNLIAGCKKDIVTGPGQDGSHVAIYGGGFLTSVSASAPVDQRFWQSYPGPHDAKYVDSSHGERFVLDACFLDGKSARLSEICENPETAFLISDQGPFPLKWPNAATGAKVSTIPKLGGGGGGGPPAGTPGAPLPRGSMDDGLTFGDRALVFFGFLGATASLIGLFGARPSR